MAGGTIERSVGTEPGPVGAESARPHSGLSVRLFERALGSEGGAALEESLVRLDGAALQRLFHELRCVREIACVRTCHRIMVVGVVDRTGSAADLLARLEQFGRPWRTLSGGRAWEHLAGVAGGLGSLAEGEWEVLEQVAEASRGVHSRHPRPLLRELLRGLVEDIRQERGHRGRPNSIAQVAAGWVLAHSQPGELIVVLGSGAVGREIAATLLPGRRVRAVSRRLLPPEGEHAGGYDGLLGSLHGAAGLVCATRSAGPVVDRRLFEGLGEDRPRWVVDLGMPRNADADLGELPGLELVDLQGLPAHRLEPGERAAAQRSARHAATRAARIFDAEAWEEERSRLWVEAEAVRQEEWERALGHAGPVSPEARLAFRRMSERLVRRLNQPIVHELRRGRSAGSRDSGIDPGPVRSDSA